MSNSMTVTSVARTAETNWSNLLESTYVTLAQYTMTGANGANLSPGDIVDLLE